MDVRSPEEAVAAIARWLGAPELRLSAGGVCQIGLSGGAILTIEATREALLISWHHHVPDALMAAESLLYRANLRRGQTLLHVAMGADGRLILATTLAYPTMTASRIELSVRALLTAATDAEAP